MADEVIATEEKQEVVAPVNPFSNEAWKAEPLATEAKEPAIKESDVTNPEDSEVFDEAVYLKQHFGVENIDDAKKELTELRAKVTTPAEIKYANEESERVFNLIKEGKTDEVLSILSEQKRLKEVDKLPAADIIKLNLQYQNKDFSPDDINELFSERYSMPEKPEQDLETDEEFAAKLAKYEKEVQKVENRISRDAKPATTELLKLQKEIVLPDIPSAKKEPVIEGPTQEELEAEQKQVELFLQTVDDVVKNFNGYETTFKAEESEIKVAYVPSAEEKKEYQPIIALAGTNAGAFMEKLGWIDKDGNINAAKISQDVPLILNKEKVFQKIASETASKRQEASIKNIKNIDYSGGKSNGDLGVTNQQLQEKLVTHFFSK